MPLLIIVTIIIVPFSIFIISFLSLVLFGYEFNFFRLVSLRKRNKDLLVKQTEPLQEINKIDMKEILNASSDEDDLDDEIFSTPVDNIDTQLSFSNK